MFNEALQNLVVTTQVTHGSTVTYHRDAFSVVLTAVVGMTSVKVESYNDGQSMRVQEFDFLIQPADLILDSSEVLPEKNDTIIFNGETYKVLPLVDDEVWVWSDNYHTQLRIHTKRVSS